MFNFIFVQKGNITKLFNTKTIIKHLKKIIALTDYKNIFSSKHNANPYRNGMDKKLLEKYFKENGL